MNVPPFHVRLDEYQDLLAGGKTSSRWAESTRAYLANARNFYLTKAGTEPADSREVNGLAAMIEADVTGELRAGEPVSLEVTVKNAGLARWLSSDESMGGVSVGVHLADGEGNLIKLDYHWERLPKPLQPGESITMSFTIPPLAAGRYRLEVDCVAAQVAWFAQVGSTPAILKITI